MSNFDGLIEQYIGQYKRNSKPIVVSFKDIIPNLNTSDRATHLIHTYPAKLLMHIPYFFLNNSVFSQKKDKVLDPFCGSGTVLLESVLAERVAIGADANPLARLISKTKTHIYDISELRNFTSDLVNSIRVKNKSEPPNVVNIDYWYLPRIKDELCSILYVIERIEDESIRDFYKVCFSNLVKKVSLADPRVSVPVRLKPEKYAQSHVLRSKSQQILENFKTLDVKSKFNEIILSNIKRFEKFNSLIKNPIDVNVDSIDARRLINNDRKINKNSIQLFISSPPYSGAQKYVRSSSLSLGWLGYTNEDFSLKNLENVSIGREHHKKEEYSQLTLTGSSNADKLIKKIFKVYPERAFIAAKYLIEMKESIEEAVRVLKPGGYFVLIAANNQVCGFEFKTQEYLCEIVQSFGLKVVFKMIDDIKSYGLMTKRNKTASVITREWVLVFEK